MIGRGQRYDLTLSQQLLFLKANPAIEGVGMVRANRLTWQMPIQPTTLARSYLATVTYRPGQTPDVQIDDPDLELLADGRSLPHVYRNPLRLCLYLPGTREWEARKRIDQTVIPWTYLWLYYFEDWLWSDDWKGEGQHPDEEPGPVGNRALRRAVTRSQTVVSGSVQCGWRSTSKAAA